MTIRIGIISCIAGILLFYSREISFMPNYSVQENNWHLFAPMLFFYLLFLILIIGIAIKSIKQQKLQWLDMTIAITSVLLFAQLNNPKGSASIVGYIGLIIIEIFMVFFIYKKKNSQIANDTDIMLKNEISNDE